MHVEALAKWAIRFVYRAVSIVQQGRPQAVSGPANSPFGANDWLVDELYQQFLEDKQSVDPAWWDFFTDYSPSEHSPHSAASKSAAPIATPASPAPATPTTQASTPTPEPTAKPAPASLADDVI